MRTYYNNNQHLNQPMNEETVFHHHSKRNQFLILSTFFCYYYCCTFSCFFFKWLFFPSKHIKIMFKVFKLILNINIEGKVCSHHTVQFCETEQKPIRYDVNMASVFWREVFQQDNYMSKVTNGNIRARCEIFSKLNIFQMSLLLTLNIFHALFLVLLLTLNMQMLAGI